MSQPQDSHADPRRDETRVEHRLERTYELPATPDEVWDAIATAGGMTSWMVPTVLDPRVGGEVSFDIGGFVSRGVVTAYEPRRRFAYEEPWPAEPGMPSEGLDQSTVTPIATEFLIESASGGSCVVRVVSSTYGNGADWEDEFFAEMFEGWDELLDRLVRHFDRAA